MIDRGHVVGGTLRTPVCIVGSGPAGMTVALELERRGVDCVLLESGDRTADPGYAALNETPQIGIATDRTRANRIRALGGTSLIWGGLCRRLDAIDFERRPWVPGSGWPITLADLMPWYEVAHRVLDLPPAEYDPAVVDPAAGSDVPLRRGDFQNVVFYYDRQPLRFALRYGPALESSTRIRTLVDATVIDLETDELGRRVEAAAVAGLGGHRFRIEADRFVLATGAINTARLLLHADGTHQNGLGNGNDQVGRNFLQHPVWRAPRLMSFGQARSLRVRRYDEAHVVMMTAVRPESARDEQLLNFHFLAMRPQPPPPDEDWRTRFGRWRQELRQDWEAGPHADDVPDYLTALHAVLARENDPVPYTMGIELRPEQAPNPSSRITLTRERDAVGMRRAVMDWRLGELDIASATRGLRLLARSMALEDIGRVDAAPEETRLPAPMGPYLHGGHHHYGTARMSASPRDGVVDADCRVHGLDNLYIAGSAVFPTTGYANPTLTIIALAARLAARVAEPDAPIEIAPPTSA